MKLEVFKKDLFFNVNKINLISNHLIVVYAFLLPISNRATSAIFSIIIILFIIRGDYLYYLKKTLNNNIAFATFLFFLLHFSWGIVIDNSKSFLDIFDDVKYYLYPIVFLSFIDRNFSYRIVSSFVFGMLYCELISYLIHFSLLPYKLEIYNKLIFEAQGINNPSPFFHHSIYNVFISVAIGITIVTLLTNKYTLFVKFISIFFIITASINLTLVGGRIGYVSFLFIIFLVFLLLYKKKIINLLFPLLLLLGTFFYFAYNNSDMFKTRINQTITNSIKLFSIEPDYNSSLGLRIGFWNYSFDAIKDNFFKGVGVGNEMETVKEYIPNKYDYIHKTIVHPHNEYIKIFLQFGVFGFILFLNIFYQIYKNKINNQNLKIILYIVTLAVALSALTDILNPKTIITFWMLVISLTTTKNNFSFDNKNKLTKEVLLYYFFVVLISLFISVLQ